MSKNTRECPVEGCPTQHDRKMAMCAVHWWRVPKLLRDELWASYREDGVLSERYIAAYDAAVEAATNA